MGKRIADDRAPGVMQQQSGPALPPLAFTVAVDRLTGRTSVAHTVAPGREAEDLGLLVATLENALRSCRDELVRARVTRELAARAEKPEEGAP